MRLARIAMEEKMKRMLVGLLLLGMVVSGVSCGSSGRVFDGYDDTKNAAYSSVKDYLQNAVTGYATDNAGALPYLTGTYSISGCTNCNIIDIAALLSSNGGMLREVPDGVYAASGSNNDNCDSGTSGCSSNNHYVWLISSVGNVYSKCIGADCDSNDTSGYQGVWP